MNRWEIFNAIIDDTSLTTQEKSLLLVIFRHVNRELGYAFPSVETLMQLSAIGSKSTFLKARKGLIEKGWLTYQTIKGKGCRYYIVPGTNLNQVQNNTEPSTKVIPLPSSNSDYKNKTSLTEDITNINYKELDAATYDYLNGGYLLCEFSTEFTHFLPKIHKII